MNTSKDLVESALNREEVDRIPFCPPFQGYWALGEAKVSVIDSINNPRLSAKAQLDVVDTCHFDAVETMWDWLLPAEAMGCKVKIPDRGTIPTASHVVKDASDMERLEIGNIKDFYRFASSREITSRISESIGKDHYLMASILSPFTMAGELRGVENLLYDSIMDEGFVTELVERSLEINTVFVEDMVGWDMDAIIICDPTASGDMISAGDYAKFSQSATTRLGDVVRKGGKTHINHICGNTSDRIGMVADTGCTAFSVDTQVDVGDAVRSMKDRISIIGNIDPAGTLYCGKPDDVRRETLVRLNKGGKRGYLLGSGCDIPVGSSLENVRAMSDVFMNF